MDNEEFVGEGAMDERNSGQNEIAKKLSQFMKHNAEGLNSSIHSSEMSDLNNEKYRFLQDLLVDNQKKPMSINFFLATRWFELIILIIVVLLSYYLNMVQVSE